MIEFTYKIKDENGIHARPAGLLVGEAKKFQSNIKITNIVNEKSADAKGLFGLMGLCVKKDNEIKVSVEGEDENEAAETIKDFLEENF